MGSNISCPMPHRLQSLGIPPTTFCWSFCSHWKSLRQLCQFPQYIPVVFLYECTMIKWNFTTRQTIRLLMNIKTVQWYFEATLSRVTRPHSSSILPLLASSLYFFSLYSYCSESNAKFLLISLQCLLPLTSLYLDTSERTCKPRLLLWDLVSSSPLFTSCFIYIVVSVLCKKFSDSMFVFWVSSS